MAKLAKTINYTVTIAAPQADRESYPDVDRLFPDLNVSALQIQPRTFIVVSTQGEYDEEALEKALQTSASYVAFVASKAKAAKVIQSLTERGMDKARLDQVRAPAGLDIQARSQEEIAVSILAEIIQLSGNQTMALKELASSPEETEAKDPICGMTVSVADAKYTSDFDGRSFFFCCRGCKQAFDKQPEKYAPAIVG